MNEETLLIIKLFTYGTISALMTASFIAYFIKIIKDNLSFKVREFILKITLAAAINFIIIFIRNIFIFEGIHTDAICYLYLKELFLDLYIFYHLFALFAYVKKTTIPEKNPKGQLKKIFLSLTDLIAWITIGSFFSAILLNSNDIYYFLSNVYKYYLALHSIFVLAIAFMIPKSLKTFKELRFSFLLLGISFFLEFLNNIEVVNVVEVIFSMKFFAYVSIIFNLFKITLSEPESFNNLRKKKKEGV